MLQASLLCRDALVATLLHLPEPHGALDPPSMSVTFFDPIFSLVYATCLGHELSSLWNLVSTSPFTSSVMILLIHSSPSSGAA